VDTPGFSVLDMPALKREEFTQYFPDFKSFADTCKFDNCLHYKERDCGVKRAVENEQILASRYQNYLTMLQEIIEKERSY
jgi:ribosome biogenesis GTPase